MLSITNPLVKCVLIYRTVTGILTIAMEYLAIMRTMNNCYYGNKSLLPARGMAIWGLLLWQIYILFRLLSFDMQLF
jgi:hypothetical protein